MAITEVKKNLILYTKVFYIKIYKCNNNLCNTSLFLLVEYEVKYEGNKMNL